MLRVTVLELPARWDGASEALREIDTLLTAGPPTDLVVVPEQALVGYVSPQVELDLTRFAEPIDGPTAQAASEICRRHRVHLTAPLVLREDDRVYNAAIVIGPDGSLVASYRKRHPWFPERWATAGSACAPLFLIGGMKVTMSICYDGHFLAEEKDTSDVLREADLLVFTSAWVDEEDSRIPLLRSLARQFRISIANANWGPGIVEVPGQGGSCIVDASGNVISSVPFGGRRADAALIATRE
jgi:predicted amidohydrolase